MKPASVEIQSVVKFHCTIVIAIGYMQYYIRSDVGFVGSEVKLIAQH